MMLWFVLLTSYLFMFLKQNYTIILLQAVWSHPARIIHVEPIQEMNDFVDIFWIGALVNNPFSHITNGYRILDLTAMMHLLLSKGLLIITTSNDDDAPRSVFNLVSLSIIMLSLHTCNQSRNNSKRELQLFLRPHLLSFQKWIRSQNGFAPKRALLYFGRWWGGGTCKLRNHSTEFWRQLLLDIFPEKKQSFTRD